MTQGSIRERELVRVVMQLYLRTERPDKCKNYNTAQSQWTLVVYKNTRGSNYGSLKVKDSKGNRTSSLGSKG